MLPKTPLFNCKSEKFLAKLLKIQYPSDYKNYKAGLKNNPLEFYKYWKKLTNGKEREFFECKPHIKQIHKRLRFFIEKMDFPEYLYSGRKGRSYLDNAFSHERGKFYYLIDIKSFYPSITADKIKTLLMRDFSQSNDVAEFISLAVTVPQNNNGEVRALATGSPLSQVFAFFINKKMFDTINELSSVYGVKFTLYVDDLSFSSKATIPYEFVKKVFGTIKSHGYTVHPSKVQYGRRSGKPEITGVRFDKNGIFITAKREEKIKNLICSILQKIYAGERIDKELKSLNASIEQACLVNPIYKEYFKPSGK